MYLLRYFASILLVSVSSVNSKSMSPFGPTSPIHPKVDVEPLSSSGRIHSPRSYYHGKQEPKQGTLPDPVMISSSIRINHEQTAPRQHGPSRRTPSGKEIKKRQIVLQQQASQYSGSPSSKDQTLYYAQQPQAYTIQQDANGAFYGTPAPIALQTVTALPVSHNQNPLYILQQPNPYSPAPAQTRLPSNFVSRTGEAEQKFEDQIQEESIAAPLRVAPQPKVSIVSHADPNSQQDPGKREQTLQKSLQQVQYEEAQTVLQNIIKQQALQQTQQQRQQHFQQQQAQQQAQAQEQLQHQHQQSQRYHHVQQLLQQKEQTQQSQALQQPQQIHAQEQLHAEQAQVDPTENGNYQAPGLLSPSPPTLTPTHHVLPNQQFVQIQQPQSQTHQVPAQRIYQGANGQTYIIHQKAPEEEHSSHSAPSQGNFVIRHQTYVAGPGGQMFTVPVPIPVQQAAAQNSREENNSGETREEDGREQRGERRNEERQSEEREKEEPVRTRKRPMNSFMRRVMEAFSVRGDASERLGTNIALPVLATTGVFFGLGALAAGWYLSNANREVGILRRTGKPVAPGTPNIKRIRRHAAGVLPAEVDQATFFQTIIQQAIEKQQGQFEGGDDPVSDPYAVDVPSNLGMTKTGRRKPLNRNDVFEDEHDVTSLNSKVAHAHPHDDHHQHHRPTHKKSWLGTRQALNFAKVAIPALIIGGAVVAIGVTIIGWYFTGSNREIAFLEPSAYSRRLKRDLTTTALSDGWVQKVLTSIHENPYEKKGGGSGVGAVGFDPFSQADTSKHNLEYHANISDAVVAVSLAVVAFFSLMGIVVAWLAAQNEKSNMGLDGAYGFGGWPGNYRRVTGRSKRKNPLTPHATTLDSALAKLETAQKRIPNFRERGVYPTKPVS